MKYRIAAFLTAAAAAVNILMCGSFTVSEKPIAHIESIENVLNGGYVTRSSAVIESESSLHILESGSLPDHYSSVSEGYTSGVKNQLSTSICWAFTQNEVLETFMAKNTGIHYDLSEQNMKFETSVYSNPESGFTRAANDGGNEYMSIAYLASGGTALEQDEPFTTSSVRSVSSSDVERFGYLKSAPIYTGESGYDAVAVKRIKELVYEYGAVGTSIYYDDTYENISRTSYYYNGTVKNANHAVTVVGWDDDYSAVNFKKQPEGDGAFIVKNSWGRYHSNGTGDLVYISYYDKFINTNFFTSEFYAENDLYEHVYEYDKLGYVTNGVLKNEDSVLCAVRFGSEHYEAVNSVGTYTPLENVMVEVYIDSDGGNVTDESDYTFVGRTTFEHPGYHLFTFDPVYVTGDGFNVAIRYTMPAGTLDAYFPIQAKINSYSQAAQNIPDTCYFGTDFSNFYCLEDILSSSLKPMLCIKAFTKETCSKGDHFYTSKYDEENHWLGCICGLSKDVKPHTFDDKCDTTCNGCKYERTVTHDYITKYTEQAHWQQCKNCDDPMEKTAHVFDDSCDKQCNFCPYTRATIHSYSIKKDETSHRYECEVCHNIKNSNLHIYDNSFDDTCNFCMYRRRAINTPSKDFTDVKDSAWYKYYVDYAVAYGMFKGTSDTTFSPDGEMTRAQFVQVLANLSGATLNNNISSGFTDVPSGKWYTGAVKWAAENGVVKGMGGGKFEPNTKIDRQQMCVILVNYVENYTLSYLDRSMAYIAFSDEDDIAVWARSSVEKCFRAGLVKGTGGGKFSPLAVATRKKGATIFTNFHKDYIA